ncbi:MAG: hypothetical protein J6P06_03275 [Aeriscardovia sp.]|nr:hypothetical protein [Aeriscardovia sp.]
MSILIDIDKLNKFMDCLDEPDFEEAAKVEAEIIEEECKNSGICRNFLTCKVINNPTTKDMIEKERGKASLQLKWDTVNLDSIHIDLQYPKSFEGIDPTYQNIERVIIDKVNESIDKAFLSKLDEKCNPPFYFLEDKITPSALMSGIAKMRSYGYRPYGAIWNSADFYELMSDQDWKKYNVTPNYEYAGWQQDLLSIRNFNSLVVPKGKVYIATSPKDLGNAIICKRLAFSQSIKPMYITFSCSIDIDLALNNKIGVVSIIKKQ